MQSIACNFITISYDFSKQGKHPISLTNCHLYFFVTTKWIVSVSNCLDDDRTDQYQQQASITLPQIANFSVKTRTGDLLFGFTIFSLVHESKVCMQIILS